MNIELKGRKAVVTESTAGIGQAVAEGLARAGASIMINGHGEEAVAQALRDLRELCPQAELNGIAADLATLEGVSALVTQVPDADIVVNNVDTARPKSFPRLAENEWMDLFELNVMSGARVARYYVGKMIERGWGRVVFISNETSLAMPKELIDYAHVKTAQLAVLREMAELVDGTGVTINAVMPGPENSELLSNRMTAMEKPEGATQREGEPPFLKSVRPTPFSSRFTTTEEVANLVIQIRSEQASGTTGAAFRVGGGELRLIA